MPFKVPTPGTPPIATETLALAVCGGVFHVTTAVFVRVVPAGMPAAICTRKRTSMDCPGCNGPFDSRVVRGHHRARQQLTPVVEPFIVGAGFTNVRRPAPALLISSVITTGVAAFVEAFVTCTR